MARPSSRHPTELELAILKILWRDGPLSVRQVRQALLDFRQLAHTSVITVMNIMVEKGYLARRKQGVSYVYRPRVREKATTKRILTDLLNRVYDGSAAALMLSLLEVGDLDHAEIQRIRGILNRRTREKQP